MFNYDLSEKVKQNKNSSIPSPYQNPTLVPPKGQTGMGPKGLTDRTQKQWNKNSSIPSLYQNPPIVPPKGQTGTDPKGLPDPTRKKRNKNSPIPSPCQNPPLIPRKGQMGMGPMGLPDPKKNQRKKNSPIPSPYQNPPLVPGPEWNTTETEDSSRTTVDHDLNIETSTVKKVIYLHRDSQLVDFHVINRNFHITLTSDTIRIVVGIN